MKKRLFSFLSLHIVFFSVFGTSIFSQDNYTARLDKSRIAGGHRGAVTALLTDDEGRLLSAGEDGFLGIWNKHYAIERFQLSPYALHNMALRPGKTQIAVAESDGFGINRISAWDYITKKRIFSLDFIDSVSYINYSAAGNFLIVSRDASDGTVIIDSDTGETLGFSDEFSGSITLAATSRSEKTMLCYSSRGILSYWNLQTKTEMQRFMVPPNIRSPVLFGNNCFIGGFGSEGLVIIDAINGSTLIRDNTIKGELFIDNPANSPSGNQNQFYCISSSMGLPGASPAVSLMALSSQGNITVIRRLSMRSSIEISSAASMGTELIVGSSAGILMSLSATASSTGTERILESNSTERIIDLASSSGTLGFVAENGRLGFLPLDYSLLQDGVSIKLEEARDPSGSGAYTRITTSPDDLVSKEPGLRKTAEPVFLLWHNGRSIPMVKILKGPPGHAEGARFFLEKIPQRYPIRSAAISGENILLLNSQGAVSLVNRDSGELRFSYTASGAVDAAFVDSKTIILGRSAVSGNTPFLLVNCSTGETVPLPYPAILGLKVYRGSGGAIYGATVSQSGGNLQTTLLQLNLSNMAQSEKLISYDGEDSSFSFAESSANFAANFATNLGGGAAALYRQRRAGAANQGREKISMERSSGLPVKIIEGSGKFIILDGEGSLCWHDGRTGKLLAVFTLYPDTWVLEKDGTILQGKITAD